MKDVAVTCLEGAGGAVTTGAGEEFAVWRKGELGDPIGMGFNLPGGNPAFCFDDVDGVAGASVGEEFAVGGKGNGELGIAAGGKGVDGFAGVEIDDDEFTGSTGDTTGDGEGFAIGMKGKGENAFRKSGDAFFEFSGVAVPQGDFVIAADEERGLIGQPGEGGDGQRLWVLIRGADGGLFRHQ